jgi:hypothetical protein
MIRYLLSIEIEIIISLFLYFKLCIFLCAPIFETLTLSELVEKLHDLWNHGVKVLSFDPALYSWI